MTDKYKILLVDDEEDIASVIKRGLITNGFHVDVFTDPMDALSRFKPYYYDLLISDIRMPGLSGIQLFKEIKKIDSRIRVLFLTAFEIQENEWRMLFPSTTSDGFIQKPASISHLVSMISRVMSPKGP